MSNTETQAEKKLFTSLMKNLDKRCLLLANYLSKITTQQDPDGDIPEPDVEYNESETIVVDTGAIDDDDDAEEDEYTFAAEDQILVAQLENYMYLACAGDESSLERSEDLIQLVFCPDFGPVLAMMLHNIRWLIVKAKLQTDVIDSTTEGPTDYYMTVHKYREKISDLIERWTLAEQRHIRKIKTLHKEGLKRLQKAEFEKVRFGWTLITPEVIQEEFDVEKEKAKARRDRCLQKIRHDDLLKNMGPLNSIKLGGSEE